MLVRCVCLVFPTLAHRLYVSALQLATHPWRTGNGPFLSVRLHAREWFPLLRDVDNVAGCGYSSAVQCPSSCGFPNYGEAGTAQCGARIGVCLPPHISCTHLCAVVVDSSICMLPALQGSYFAAFANL